MKSIQRMIVIVMPGVCGVGFGGPSTPEAPFALRSIPTPRGFRDGILLFEQAGALPAAALEDFIRQVRALEMNEVRKQLVAREAGQHPGGTPRPDASGRV
jgi:mRNA-degrading endonuclease toxin of MazEF toxin-antitoxin module